MSESPTAWHTIGPFFPGTFFRPGDNDLTRATPDEPPGRGRPIVLRGSVRQDGGRPVINAVLEAWQADAGGLFRHPADPGWRQADASFFGWGRAWTDREGRFEFQTIFPGGYDDRSGRRAPHINIAIYASGIMRHLNTVVFFPGERDNDGDPVLACVPLDLRARLIADSIGLDAAARQVFSFDIILRGSNETPFFLD